MFDSWLLETFSKTPWWTVPLLWLPLVCRSLHQALLLHSLSPPLCLLYSLLGLLAWAAVEYVLHRFVFHCEPSSAALITLHFSLHGCHHKRPMDRLRLVFPPLFASPIVFFFWHLCHAAAAEPGRGAALFAGMLAGYVTYDCTHFFTHHTARARGWLALVRRTHLAHHFVDSTASFGVSSPLLDFLCGTRPLLTRR